MKLSDEELNKMDVTTKELNHLIKTIVTVLDIANYNSDYQEQVPFKATLFWITGDPAFANYWVRSLVTGKEYEIYDHQILETGGDPEVFGVKYET
jgi:hypothetical protein